MTDEAMKTSKLWKTVGGGLALLVAGAIFFGSRDRSPAANDPSEDRSSSETSESAEQTKETSVAQRASTNPQQPSPNLHPNRKETGGKAGGAAAAQLLDTRTVEDLKRLSEIRKKVFASDSDKAERARLLGDATFLRSLEPVLRSPAVSTDSEELQDLALDALMEAHKANPDSTSAEVFRSVVQDAQVESASLALEARRNLGGIKAEILYHWTAVEPTKVAEMRSWLPGPTSNSIFDNVLARLRSNLAESRLELGR